MPGILSATLVWMIGLGGVTLDVQTAGLPTPIPDPTATNRIACVLDAPIVELDTRSKYGDAGRHGSVVSVNHAARREVQMAPLRTFVRRMDRLSRGSAADRSCARENLAAWADAGALGRMRTKDAHLSRSRMVAELWLSAARLDTSPDDGFDDRQRSSMAKWARTIGHDTARFFRRSAGRTSRRNNHRAWAALAVGLAARRSGDRKLERWSRKSVDVALCQVDEGGVLPLERARGARALRYHFYALRPLIAFDRSVAPGYVMAGSRCAAGMVRLTAMLLEETAPQAAPSDEAAGRFRGPQMQPAPETHYGTALRFDRSELARYARPIVRTASLAEGGVRASR